MDFDHVALNATATADEGPGAVRALDDSVMHALSDEQPRGAVFAEGQFFDAMLPERPVMRSAPGAVLAAEPCGLPDFAAGSAKDLPWAQTPSKAKAVQQPPAYQGPDAPELPADPFPVAPEHFYTLSPLGSVLGALEAALGGAGASTRFDPEQVRFWCECAVEERAVSFVARVWRADPHRLLVELQKRAGPTLAWRAVYASVSASLAALATGDVCAQAPRRAAMGAAGAPHRVLAPPSVGGPPCVAHAGALAEMAASGCSVQSAEACAAVAALARDAGAAARLLDAEEQAGVVRALGCALERARDDDVVRCAAAAVANLAAAGPLPGAAQVVQGLASALGSSSVLAQREAARALAELVARGEAVPSVPVPSAAGADAVVRGHLSRAGLA